MNTRFDATGSSPNVIRIESLRCATTWGAVIRPQSALRSDVNSARRSSTSRRASACQSDFIHVFILPAAVRAYVETLSQAGPSSSADDGMRYGERSLRAQLVGPSIRAGARAWTPARAAT